MKQFRLLLMSLLAVMAMFFTYCNDADDTATDEATADTAVAATTTSEPAAAIESANIMIVKHRVRDYSKWKTAYDKHDSLRLASGVHSYVIGRGVEDSNMVMVATKVDDIDKAKAFGKSDHLKKAMKEGGVTGTPSVVLANVPFLKPTVNSDLRAMSFIRVKDWEAWKTSFEGGRQYRLDNGMEDRAYGHDIDDNHKVIVVGAILDSAKVRAYYKSDSLKARMKASGVEGTPERFWYKVVQSY